MSRHSLSGTIAYTPLARRIDELAERAARQAAEHGPETRLASVQQAIEALRSEISDAQRRQEVQADDVAVAVANALKDIVERQQDLDQRHGALLARLEDEARAAGELRQQLVAELADARTSLLPAVDQARDQLLRQAETMTTSVTGAVLAKLDERLGSAAAQLAEQRGEIHRALGRLEELVAGTGEATGSLDRTRQDLVREIAMARGELHTTAGVMTGAQAVLDAGVRRIESSGEAMVRYLDDRDLALEVERDRLLREVLEDFADTLGARERRTVARRLIGVVDRRRDSRDAARWRRANPRELAGQLESGEAAAPAAPAVIDLDAARAE